MAGNSFGTLFRFTTFGESHGAAIGCVYPNASSGGWKANAASAAL